ncbi:dipeptidase [Salinibacter ruber]|jgi:membrane dipeptidase|uniref:dipeptidase n=1 Tax=Salinibacter ruber TaxID=146919 RepID=UPI000C9F54B5|nr:dipeptidase [Salinibacter ruber]MBB4090173.1 membrane dipeptidase [Salinibacter ruber]MCS3647498.1 membrane dipeptidase [Salinibacter ruber]MCS4138056.1 membrane dipeptidase [Salinibacter ruber]MCS4197074.1 membrane dipeptidase [Salinibacter ruber]MCS4201384.1 membrane dipeptidase [Salinibacter ruber]
MPAPTSSLIVGSFVLLLMGSGVSQAQPAASIEARADSLVQASLLVDGHVDLPYRLNDFYENPADSTVGGDVDYPRARAGGLDAPFMSIYIPPYLQSNPAAATNRADALIDLVEKIATDHPTEFALATSPNEVRQIATTEAVALPLGMENGAGLGGELDNVEHFYDRGIRYITLTHGAHNRLGDSSYDDAEPRWNGLSPFGEQVIAEMNRLGIMVDVSHVTDATALDAIEQSDAPVIASHSSCRHFTPGWERNVSDELIEGIADTGGVVMITFGSSFLRNAYRDRDAPIRDAMNAHIDSMGWAEDSREAVVYEQQTRREHPIGTVQDVADHIDHAVGLVGTEHVGLGSDFDGVFALPEGLQDASGYPALVAELLRRGYSDPAIQQILGANLLRVWTEVEATAERRSE